MKTENSTSKDTFDPKNLLTVVQYSQKHGVSRQVIYNWIANGRIKQVNYLGKTWVDTSTFIPAPEKEAVK